MTNGALYNIWTDGSYRSDARIVGAAWVIREEGVNVTCEGRRSFASLKREFQPHGSDVAEMTAVALALNAIPRGAQVRLHVDCQNVVNWLNAGSITTTSKTHITPLRNAFTKAMRSISAMESVEIIKVSGSDVQHNKAHILSRLASAPALRSATSNPTLVTMAKTIK